ncbi:hypothetical protein [Agrobacterium vitis]|nr:hypothetical protein [Agrobacterium vitis]WEO72083.1 hypothetical protein G6L01_001645 [Agrobacterium vitis]
MTIAYLFPEVRPSRLICLGIMSPMMPKGYLERLDEKANTGF